MFWPWVFCWSGGSLIFAAIGLWVLESLQAQTKVGRALPDASGWAEFHLGKVAVQVGWKKKKILVSFFLIVKLLIIAADDGSSIDGFPISRMVSMNALVATLDS